MANRLSRSLTAACLTIVVGLTGMQVAAAAPSGSQPLPGYTINNPPLPPIQAGGGQTTVKQGVLGHAAFDIEIPPNWNGELVMWAHGYRGTGAELTVDPPSYGLRQLFAEQGYAWAASSYYANGYDVKAGVLSTHDLAKFAGKVLPNRPKRVYLVGVSMGGHVIGRSLEEYPNFYAGALPMCGVLGDNRLFDFFLDFNLVAQDLADVPAYPPTASYLTAQVPTIQSRLGLTTLVPGGPDTTNALGKQLRAVTINRSGGPRPGAEASFAVWKDFLFTLATPDNGQSLSLNPGRLSTNILTKYSPSEPVNINRTVKRVLPTDLYSKLTRKLTEIPRILGKPRVPVLSLHGLGDMFVPFSMEQIYHREVAWSGQGKLLVQRAIRSSAHCEFTPTEVGTAWNDLRSWVSAKGAKAQAKARPAGDDVTSAKVIASPTYGCRFTDPTAYATPVQFPTRPLFSRCPAS